MIRSRLPLAVIAGLLLALWLIAAAPARLLPLFLDDQSVALSGLRGTVWQGHAARAVLLTQAGPLHLGALQWRLQPLSLLSLSPSLHIDAVWGGQRLSLSLRQRGELTELRDIDASLDAALLRQVLPVGLRGRIGLQLSRVHLGPARLRLAEGNVVWQDAAWENVSGVGVLGSYAARLSSPREGTVEAQVETLAGPVTASGNLRLEDSRYWVDARIGSNGAMDPQLAQALSLVAVPEENGYLLRLDGDLPATP